MDDGPGILEIWFSHRRKLLKQWTWGHDAVPRPFRFVALILSPFIAGSTLFLWGIIYLFGYFIPKELWKSTEGDAP